MSYTRKQLEADFQAGKDLHFTIQMLSLTDEELAQPLFSEEVSMPIKEITGMPIYDEICMPIRMPTYEETLFVNTQVGEEEEEEKVETTSTDTSSEEDPLDKRIRYGKVMSKVRLPDIPRSINRNLFPSEQGSTIIDPSRFENHQESEIPYRYQGYADRSGYRDRNDQRRKQGNRQRFVPVTGYIPKEYDPREYNSQSVLNIDCAGRNDQQIIAEWADQISLTIQSNESLRTDIAVAEAFVGHKLKGKVRDWFNFLPEHKRALLKAGCTTGRDYFIHLTDAIYAEFTGKNQLTAKEETRAKEVKNAIWHLTNMSLCDMCLWKNFICEWEEYYYKLIPDSLEQKGALEMLLNKIPRFVTEVIRPQWDAIGRPMHTIEETSSANTTVQVIPKTLGGLRYLVDEYLKAKCNERYIGKQLKSTTRICCDPNQIEIPGQYGCYRQSRKKKSHKKRYKKHKKHKYAKKYRFRKRTVPYYKEKYRQKPYRRKFFTKKTSNTLAKKAENCPKGSTNCRCWLCNQVGHYANTCPNKKQSDKVKLLEQVYKMQLQPIEDEDLEWSENDSLYELESCTESEYDSEESDSLSDGDLFE